MANARDDRQKDLLRPALEDIIDLGVALSSRIALDRDRVSLVGPRRLASRGAVYSLHFIQSRCCNDFVFEWQVIVPAANLGLRLSRKI
jgi:hypothetical protein